MVRTDDKVEDGKIKMETRVVRKSHLANGGEVATPGKQQDRVGDQPV